MMEGLMQRLVAGVRNTLMIALPRMECTLQCVQGTAMVQDAPIDSGNLACFAWLHPVTMKLAPGHYKAIVCCCCDVSRSTAPPVLKQVSIMERPKQMYAYLLVYLLVPSRTTALGCYASGHAGPGTKVASWLRSFSVAFSLHTTSEELGCTFPQRDFRWPFSWTRPMPSTPLHFAYFGMGLLCIFGGQNN